MQAVATPRQHVNKYKLPKASPQYGEETYNAGPAFTLIHKGDTPGDDEVRTNPRARSAKLRVLERVQ